LNLSIVIAGLTRNLFDSLNTEIAVLNLIQCRNDGVCCIAGFSTTWIRIAMSFSLKNICGGIIPNVVVVSQGML